MRVRHYIPSLLLLSGVAALLAAMPVQAVGTIGGRPALPREEEPRSQSIFIHRIDRGQTINEKVLVSNQSDKTQTIILYPVDAIPTNTGAFTCKQKAEAITDAGGWIELAEQEITLKAGASDIIDLTITAPSNADVGEHNACIAFENKFDEGELSGNLRIHTRSAVRVALTIPGTLQRELDIKSFSVTQANYHQRYGIHISNKGNVSADTNVTVQLLSLFGSQVYTNGGQYPILPSEDLSLEYDNDQSPFFGGWYVAKAAVSYDPDATTWGTQRTNQLKTLHAKDQLVFIWPQPLAMLIILLAIGGFVWLVMWRSVQERIRHDTIGSWQAHRVEKGDTLLSLTSARRANWKKVAKINRLKAPYALRPGSVIYLPRKAPTSKSKRTKEV